MRRSAAAIVLVWLFVVPQVSESAIIDLESYAFNIDTAISEPPLGDPVPAEADISGFSEDTGLGTITVTTTGAGAHNTALFVDHDIDEPLNTFFNEYGDVFGAPTAGQSWEIDEPGFVSGDIFTNFSANTLDGTNALPAGSEDDVSMALGWDFVLAAGQTAVASFFVSETEPAGFYLSQTDLGSDATIYFSSALEIRGPGGPIIPEPASLAVWMLLGIVGTGAFSRRRNRS